MGHRLSDLAEVVGGRVVGNPHRVIDAIRSLEAAGPRDLSFIIQPRYRKRAAASAAGALLVEEPGGDNSGAGSAPLLLYSGRDLLVAGDAAFALSQLLPLFHPPPLRAPGVHSTAVIGAGCEIHPAAHIGPYVVVGAESRVGPGAAILPLAVLGERVTVGEGAVIHPHAVLYDGTEVGPRCEVHAGVVLGADGFGYATHGGEHHKIPQVGRVVLEADVEIGANTTIDRATFGETRVGEGTKIDDQVMLGHNVQVGRNALLCAQVGVAGSTRIGDAVIMAGKAAAVGHLEIGNGVIMASGAGALQSVPAGRKVAGIPAIELGAWRRQTALTLRLEEIYRRLREVERHARASDSEAPPSAREEE